MMDRFRILPNYRYYDSADGIIKTAYEKPLRDYKICGNSVQNGTPSPDNPIEIQNVGDYDEETGKYKISIEVSNENGDTRNYNIFLDEPLRKVGEYADYIDLESRKVVRCCIEKIFNGSEIWYEHTNNKYYSPLYPDNISGLAKALCNQYEWVKTTSSSNLEYGDCYVTQRYDDISEPYCNFFINCIGKYSLSELKEYISQNNIVLIAQVKNVIEEVIDLPEIKLSKGTNIIAVKTTTQPSAVSYQYYA